MASLERNHLLHARNFKLHLQLEKAVLKMADMSWGCWYCGGPGVAVISSHICSSFRWAMTHLSLLEIKCVPFHKEPGCAVCTQHLYFVSSLSKCLSKKCRPNRARYLKSSLNSKHIERKYEKGNLGCSSKYEEWPPNLQRVSSCLELSCLSPSLLWVLLWATIHDFGICCVPIIALPWGHWTQQAGHPPMTFCH